MKWKKTLRGAILALSHFLFISPISVRRTAAVCCEWSRFQCSGEVRFTPNSRCFATLVVWKTELRRFRSVWNAFILLVLAAVLVSCSVPFFGKIIQSNSCYYSYLLRRLFSPKGLYTYALRSHIRANLIQLRERAGVWATVKSALASMGITCTEGVFLFGNPFPRARLLDRENGISSMRHLGEAQGS